MNKKFIKNIVSGIVIAIVIIIIGFIWYDRSTVNNKYYISEADLKIPIFVYHDIVNSDSEIEFDYMQTTKEKFEQQMLGLEKVGYHFITYEDLQQYYNGNKKLYKKSCLVTFDDGYKGVYENAYPIVKEYNIPITIFVITDNMEKDGVLTWDETKEMSESGLVTIASHSTNHPEFTKLSSEEALENVNESYEIISEKIGENSTKIFTYPYGLYTEDEVQCLKENGYIQNLTDNKINKSNNLDIYSLHRCYPLNDSVSRMIAKIFYRSIRY